MTRECEIVIEFFWYNLDRLNLTGSCSNCSGVRRA